jgi:hypothetical protein
VLAVELLKGEQVAAQEFARLREEPFPEVYERERETPPWRRL